jgi:hypothetical protein
MHEAMRVKFLPSSEISLNGEEFSTYRSTTKLNTSEFEEYLANIRTWAARDMNIYIPEPNESRTVTKTTTQAEENVT